jgi:hypothetical protein
MNCSPSPFFIWFMGRSGSTYLCDLLNSHPQIFCRKEDFSDIRVERDSPAGKTYRLMQYQGASFFRRLHLETKILDDPDENTTVEYLRRVFSQPYSACGFKLKFPNQPAVFPELVPELQHTPGIAVIALRRENVLKQAISLQNLPRISKTAASQSSNAIQGVSLEPLWLDIPTAVSHARYFLRIEPQFEEFLRPFPKICRVNYEELLDNSELVLAEILTFLEVDPNIRLQSVFHKTTPDSMQDALLNYEELVAEVQGTNLEKYLD